VGTGSGAWRAVDPPRALGGAYFDAGMTDKAEELFRSWLDADPGRGWGWIGWADCYLPWGGRSADFDRAGKLLRRGYRVPGVRDRADIADRLQEVCEDSGRPGEARQFGEQAGRLRHEPVRLAARLCLVGHETEMSDPDPDRTPPRRTVLPPAAPVSSPAPPARARKARGAPVRDLTRPPYPMRTIPVQWLWHPTQ